MKKHTSIFLSAILCMAAYATDGIASKVFSLPMEIIGTTLKADKANLQIEGRFSLMQIAGKEGQAWRTDGNSSRAVGYMPQVVNGNAFTASLRFAIDTYAIIRHEDAGAQDVFVEIVSCLDEGKRSGFGFFMNRTGKYMVKTYIGNNPIEIKVDESIPLWQWNELSIAVDGNKATLYLNGQVKGSANAPSAGVKIGDATLYIGRANQHGDLGGAETCAFNGAFDDLSIYDEVIKPEYTASYADLNLPADRYSDDRLRAKFHGQPGMNWTNETHGLFHNINGDGKWHAFFQRTGSVPMMSHQHWGHIISDDLITWRDEKPVLAPSEYYDIKGCWSGCVFSDKAFNNGKPTIIYTGVDYAQPYGAMAFCDDSFSMRDWHKTSSSVLNFNFNDKGYGHGRDTFFYRTDSDNAYLMVGAHNAVLYYRWNGSSWDYKGEFYRSHDGIDSGNNIEMPNVIKIGDKWVMTSSPLAGGYGTTCLYRTGDLNDGKFVNYSDAQRVDFFGRDGFGLLSPSPSTTPDGKTVVIGIVPDKLPGYRNLELGYAHLYSLPREWSLDNEGRLLQKPYGGISLYRDNDSKYETSNIELNGSLNLNPVRGREAEIDVTFKLGDSKVGVNFFKNASNQAAILSYNPKNKEISLDYSRIARFENDPAISSFSSILPLGPTTDEDLRIQLFIDHSIIDIFVNERYASSVRIFPTDENAEIIELFSEGNTLVKNVTAYVLGTGDMQPDPVTPPEPETLDSTGKIGLYVGYPDPQTLMGDNTAKEEQATYSYFINRFGEQNVIWKGQYDRLNTEDFDVIWVNCDRRGINRGWNNLPEGYSDSRFVNALKNYNEKGGNLYLTKMASQLIVAIGRIDEPGDNIEFGNGNGDMHDDLWEMNVRHHGYDWSQHPALAEFDYTEYNENRKTLILMSGRHNREDHNCMWKLNNYGGHDRFCSIMNAQVLGTWGHNDSDARDFAGLIEFFPQAHIENSGINRMISEEAVEARKGTVIVNGLAAYEWAPLNGINNSQANIENLTTNLLYYLSPKSGTITDVDQPYDFNYENETCEYYNLQGMKIENPTTGIYIIVKGNKSYKTIIR